MLVSVASKTRLTPNGGGGMNQVFCFSLYYSCIYCFYCIYNIHNGKQDHIHSYNCWRVVKREGGRDKTKMKIEVKSRKYQGVFEVKSRVKTWQVRGNLVSTIGALASPKMGGRNQVSGRVSVPCWLATPVANAPWKPLIIRWRSSSV